MKTINLFGKDYLTYATVEEADEYFNTVLGSNWVELGEVQKAQVLITATKMIDRKDYQGEKVAPDQPLKFPRIINGLKTIDMVLVEACCELAQNIFNDGGKDKNIANLKSVSLGDSSVSFKDDFNVESEDELIIQEYLGEYLKGGVQVIL